MRLRKWVVVPVVVILLVTVSVFAYRALQLRGVPDIGHPFDVEEFGTINIDPADNAKADYEESLKVLSKLAEPDEEEIELVLKGNWSDATQEVQNWLRDDSLILEQWQSGTEINHYLIEQPEDLTTWNTMVSASEMQAISRLSRLAASQAESEGRFNEAWQWHRALFRYSRHLGMHSTLVSHQIGSSCHSMAVAGIMHWANNEFITADQLSRALEDIFEGNQLTALPSSRIRAEYFATLNEINRIEEMRATYKQVNERLKFAKEFMSVRFGFDFDSNRFPGSVEMYFTNEPELTKRLLQHQVANLLTFADLPLSDRPPLVEGDITYFDAVSDETEFMAPTEFLNAASRSQYACLTLLKAGWNEQERARQAMLEVILAAEWYRREHGTFPESLEEMVAAEMLSSVPIDPMSLKGGFVGFERNPENPLQAKVWCAGHNGTDEGGALDIRHASYFGDYGFKIGRTDK